MPAPRRRRLGSALCPGCLPARAAPDPAGLGPGVTSRKLLSSAVRRRCLLQRGWPHGGGGAPSSGRSFPRKTRPAACPVRCRPPSQGPGRLSWSDRSSLRHLSPGLVTPDFLFLFPRFLLDTWRSLGTEAISFFPCVRLTHPRAFRTRGADVELIPESPQSGILGVLPTPRPTVPRYPFPRYPSRTSSSDPSLTRSYPCFPEFLTQDSRPPAR